MFSFDWTPNKIVHNKETVNEFIRDLDILKPNLFSIDTETTGLNIVIDKPFFYQVAIANQKTMKGFSYTMDLRDDPELAKEFIKISLRAAWGADYLIGHNVVYDLHMLYNIGVPYEGNNLTDTQIMIRLGSDALPIRRGGESMSLKLYATRHIDPSAKRFEKDLKVEQKNLAAAYNQPLKELARKHGIRSIDLDKILKDALFTPEMLPEGFRQGYVEWLNNLPEKIQHNMKEGRVKSEDIPYYMLDVKNLHRYGAYDVIYTIETFQGLEEVIKVRKNEATWERENKLLKPVFNMERQGFKINKEYVEEVNQPMRDYILELRKEIQQIVGQKMTVHQHKVFKDFLENEYGLEVESTGKEALDELLSELKTETHAEAIHLIEKVQELRQLESWFSTYFLRFLKEMQITDTVYTQMNQATPVTGRFSSDFQQFPNGAITKPNGEVIYEPRRMVQKHDKYDYLVAIDYSQIELRVQALYTILLGAPDLNLSRAYMPYECYTVIEGNKYDFNCENPKHLKLFGNSTWYHKEDDVEWHPVDVHAATTSQIYPDMDTTTEEFKHLRGSVGKRLNFAKNYGASIKQTKIMFGKDRTEEELQWIDGAYYRAFPGVKQYQQYCYSVAAQGYMTNLFGRRYYNISGHNGMNALVQGSAADLLKERIIDLENYIQENHLKSRMIVTIHDEIFFGVVREELHHVDKFVEIMETFKGSRVPIVAEVEFTDDTWADLKGANNASDIIQFDKNKSSD